MSPEPQRGPLEVHDGLIWRHGQPLLLKSATIQYFRLAPAEWADRLEKIRRCGFDAAEVYVPWNHHETAPGRFDFTTGRRDLVGFLRLCQEAGLDVLLRPGPYICAEYEGGGLPARLCLLPPGSLREAAAPYLSQALPYWRAVLAAVAPLQADRGGPVAMLQVENELDYFPSRDPAAIVRLLAEEARAAGITVPLSTCAGDRIAASGGEVEGILGGINVKPPPRGPWEDRYRALGEALGARGVPLMVIETFRDSAVLRRLVGVGAKLLGPYMVSGGVHLGPTAPSNNWAPVPAFLASDYDFRSPIAADGYLRPGYTALQELFRTLALFGPFFGRALPVDVESGPDVPAGVYLHAIAHGGERALSVTNDGEAPVRLTRPWPGGDATVHLAPGDSLLVLEGVALHDATPLWSTLEPVAYDAGGRRLTVVGRPAQAGSVAVGADTPTAVVVPAEPGAVAYVAAGPLAVEVRARAAPPREELGPNPLRNLPCPDPEPSHCLPLLVRTAALSSPPWPGGAKAAGAGGHVPSLEELEGPGTGEVWYAFDALGARAIACAAADLAALYVDGAFAGAALPGGRAVAWPLPPGARRLWLRVVSWGHSPFWDERLPSLRMGSRRGIVGEVRLLASVPTGAALDPSSPVRLAGAAEMAAGAPAAPIGLYVLSDHRGPWLYAVDAGDSALALAFGLCLRARVEGIAAGTRVHLRMRLADAMAAVYLDGLLVGRHLSGPALSPHMTGGALPDGEFVLPWGLLAPGRPHELEIRLWPLGARAGYGAPEWCVYPS